MVVAVHCHINISHTKYVKYKCVHEHKVTRYNSAETKIQVKHTENKMHKR